jgi:hypothetical protein
VWVPAVAGVVPDHQGLTRRAVLRVEDAAPHEGAQDVGLELRRFLSLLSLALRRLRGWLGLGLFKGTVHNTRVAPFT